MRAMISLKAAEVGFAARNDLHLPALALGIAGVHAEQVAGEQRRLVAAGAGTDFEEQVALVVGVRGSRARCSSISSRAISALADACSACASSFISGSVEHLAGTGKVGAGATVSMEQFHHRRDVGTLARQLAIAVHVARGLLAAEQAVDFGKTITNNVQCSRQVRKNGAPALGKLISGWKDGTSVHQRGNISTLVASA
jgi:hypothetical protein